MLTAATNSSSNSVEFIPPDDEIKLIIQQFKTIHSQPLEEVIINYLKKDSKEEFEDHLYVRFYKLDSYFRTFREEKDFRRKIQNPDTQFEDDRLIKTHKEVLIVIKFREQLAVKKEFLNARETRFLAECYYLTGCEVQALELFIKGGEKLNDLSSLARAAEIDETRMALLMQQFKEQETDHPLINNLIALNPSGFFRKDSFDVIMEYYEKSASKGNIFALSKLGSHYQIQMEYNTRQKGYRFLSQAASRGDARSLSLIGKMYCQGEKDWSLGLHCLCLGVDACSLIATTTLDSSHRTLIMKNDFYLDLAYYTAVSIKSDVNESRDHNDPPYERFNQLLRKYPEEMMGFISNNLEFLPRVMRFLDSENLTKIKNLNKARQDVIQSTITHSIFFNKNKINVPQFRNEILNIIDDYVDASAEIVKMDKAANKKMAKEFVKSMIEKTIARYPKF